MSNAQQLANHLHGLGYSDSVIGSYLECSREHVNRIRNGKKEASEHIESALASLVSEAKKLGTNTVSGNLTQPRPAPQRAAQPRTRAQNEETEEEEYCPVSSWLDTVIEYGLYAFMGLIVIGSGVGAVRKKQSI